MTSEERQYRVFTVAKFLASDYFAHQKCYVSGNDILDQCQHADLSDARVLYRMFLKEIAEFNSKIKSKITLLDKMKYKSDYLSSVIFKESKPPVKAIEKIISENPEKTPYECYRLLKDQK